MERYKRVYNLVNDDNFAKINKSCVCVIGCGGVGSYAIESLARSGVGTIIIIDNDVIDITNLNRQLFTDMSNIGENKVGQMKKRINSYSLSNVIELNMFLDNDNIDILDNYKIDYIIDACDTMATKKIIIDKCISDKIKLISAMGTGNKLDGTKLKIMNICDTKYDKIARIMRKYVKDKGYKEKIMVVCSDEEIQKNSGEINSICYMPAICGLLCSQYVIQDIIKK